MNKTIGAIICTGLTWLGLQAEVKAQNITITIGGEQDVRVHRNVVIPQRNYQNGVVYKPGTRRISGVVYHGAPIRPTYRENTVIYSPVYRHRYPPAYYRQRDIYVYPSDRHWEQPIYYYRDRYFRHY